jgi:hypothetical protein
MLVAWVIWNERNTRTFKRMNAMPTMIPSSLIEIVSNRKLGLGFLLVLNI